MEISKLAENEKEKLIQLQWQVSDQSPTSYHKLQVEVTLEPTKMAEGGMHHDIAQSHQTLT